MLPFRHCLRCRLLCGDHTLIPRCQLRKKDSNFTIKFSLPALSPFLCVRVTTYCSGNILIVLINVVKRYSVFIYVVFFIFIWKKLYMSPFLNYMGPRVLVPCYSSDHQMYRFLLWQNSKISQMWEKNEIMIVIRKRTICYFCNNKKKAESSCIRLHELLFLCIRI